MTLIDGILAIALIVVLVIAIDVSKYWKSRYEAEHANHVYFRERIATILSNIKEHKD